MKTLFKNVKLFGIFVVALSLLVSLSGFPLAVSAQTAIETDFMNIMNAQRIALGKNSLAINSSLSTAAYLHSKDMAENNYFSHVSLDGRTMVQRVTAAGYMNWTSLGENIAYCYGAPDANIVYDMWKNSPGHYANMIGNFADAGLGVFTLNNYTYYTLDLGENMTPGSSDATLSNLTISSGTLTPGFTSWNTGYIDSVGNGVNSVTVAPTVNQANATVTVNGTGVTSGTASGAINLVVGTNTITVKVTAQNGSTTNTYTIVVTRAAAALSSDATLSGLTISSGTLTPGFTAGNTGYTDSVGNGVSSVTVTPIVNQANATITVNGTGVTSGTASGAISLVVGPNTITVKVTAQDGITSDTYTIVVTRAAAALSSDATLSGLTISSGTLTPGFTSGNISYTDSVGSGVNSVTVTATVHQGNATVKVNGTPVSSGSPSRAISLNVGSNTISILVTAQDGVTQDVYAITITVNKAVIQGTTYSANGMGLGGVTLTMDGTTQVTSASDGIYQLVVTGTGYHTIVASETGYRSQAQTLIVTDLTATYPLDFKGGNGLVPNAPSVSFVLACINKWKYPPSDGTGLDISKILSIINAWKYPIN